MKSNSIYGNDIIFSKVDDLTGATTQLINSTLANGAPGSLLGYEWHRYVWIPSRSVYQIFGYNNSNYRLAMIEVGTSGHEIFTSSLSTNLYAHYTNSTPYFFNNGEFQYLTLSSGTISLNPDLTFSNQIKSAACQKMSFSPSCQVTISGLNRYYETKTHYYIELAFVIENVSQNLTLEFSQNGQFSVIKDDSGVDQLLYYNKMSVDGPLFIDMNPV